MKTINIFFSAILLILCCSCSLFKQTDKNIETNIITLDVSPPGTTSLESSTKRQKRLIAKSRQPISFQVKGGNPLKYRYSINHKFINFFEHPENNPLDKAISDIQAKSIISSSTTTQENLTANTIALGQKNKEKEEKVDKKNKTKQNQTEITKLTEEIDSIKKQRIIIIEKLLPENERSILSEEELFNIKISEIQQLTVDKAQELYLILTVLSGDIKLYRETKCSEDLLIYTDFLKDRFSFNERLKSIIQSYTDLSQKSQANGSIENKYYIFLKTQIENTLKEIGDILVIFNNVREMAYTLPIDANGKNFDALEILVQRVEIRNPAVSDTYSYNIWMRGGFKIDISGGVFITSLVNGEYYSTPAIVNGEPSSTMSIVRKKEKGNFEFGFGSTVNVSHRSGSWINPTLNAGFLFTANQQFQFITGFGIILGKQERLIFSGGLAMGTVTRISESIELDNENGYNLGSSGSIPTDNQFDFGYFFGLTYNLTKTKIKETN